MPKRIIKGVGMMQRETLQYDVSEPGALEALITVLDRVAPLAEPEAIPGEALDRDNAARCRAILATVGLGDMMDGKGGVFVNPLREKGLDEDSAHWIAAHWLGAYNRMMAQRAKLIGGGANPNTIGSMLMHAQEMGRLQERLFWRAGVDPQTGKRREELALGKRNQQLAIPKAAEARRKNAAENEPEWWDHARIRANEIRKSRPNLSRSKIASLIAEEVRHSERQVRDVIKSVC